MNTCSGIQCSWIYSSQSQCFFTSFKWSTRNNNLLNTCEITRHDTNKSRGSWENNVNRVFNAPITHDKIIDVKLKTIRLTRVFCSLQNRFQIPAELLVDHVWPDVNEQIVIVIFSDRVEHLNGTTGLTSHDYLFTIWNRSKRYDARSICIQLLFLRKAQKQWAFGHLRYSRFKF